MLEKGIVANNVRTFPYCMIDVGFAVGGDSGINYVVLQVHYAAVDSFQGETTNMKFILTSI